MTSKKRLITAASVFLCALLLAVSLNAVGQPLPMANTALNLDFSLVFGDSETVNTPATFTPSAKYPYENLKANIDSHAAINRDVKGWLTIPNTNIDYPVLYSASDNNYYMYRDWRGNNYPNTNYLNYTTTAIYADYRTRFSNTSWQTGSKNTVLYGHNWTNLRNPLAIGNQPGYVMFEQLPSYTNMDFARENPYIYYSTGDLEGVWVVFSVAYCELSADFFYNNPNPSTEAYQSIISEWQQRSLFNFGVDVNTDDRILTLTTCTRMYNASSYQRYCVVARLLRPGEADTDAITVANNPNIKAPDFSRIYG